MDNEAMIKYRYNENIFNSKSMTIVNTVNCVGVMGAGIAKEFKLRFPEMFKDYVKKCNANEIRIGKLDIYKINNQKIIINFPTKDHWKYPSKMEYIKKGLEHFVQNYKSWNITSVAFPQLGCGKGGLKWKDVKHLMEEYLTDLDINIEVYVND